MPPLVARFFAAFAISAAAIGQPALARADAPSPGSVASSSQVAAAGAPPGSVAPPASTATSWYGYQNLIIDSAAIALAIGIGSGDGSHAGRDATAIWLTGYLLGGPIVHAAHGRWGIAAASIALRGTAPVIFGLLGHGFDSCSENGDISHCDYNGLGAGLLLGLVVAISADSILLAREPETDPGKPALDGTTRGGASPAEPRGIEVSVTPAFSMHGAGIGAIVSF